MKAARLKGDLLMRKGTAAPVPGVETAHRTPVSRPQLAAIEPASAKRKTGGAKTRPRGRADADLKRDKFGRVRVSLRLDPHRHLRLKLLSAHNRMSLQDTLIAAVDAYLGDEARSANDGNCDCLHEPDEDSEPVPGTRNEYPE